MDVCSLRDKLFGRGVTEAAMILDPDGVREVELQHQMDWDDGRSFLGLTSLIGAEREDDSEKEKYSVAEHLQFDLEAVVHDHWLTSLTRDEVIALCRIMNRSQITTPPTFSVCQGMEYTAKQIVFDWNDIFPTMQITEQDICG